MKSFRTIKKNAKALSPVVASIILIAVTVAVSVVVAAWMGGMSVGLMGNAEQGTITNVAFSGGNTMAVTIQNTGQSLMNFTAAYVNGATSTPTPAFATQGIAKGASQTYSLSATYVSGTEYTLKFTTTKANNLVLTVVAP
jgi:archaeal type IV pilus assembly protein PilA